MRCASSTLPPLLPVLPLLSLLPPCRLPFALRPVPRAALCLAALAALAGGAHAQEAAAVRQTGAVPALTATPMLAEQAPTGPGNEGPTFVFGDRLSGRTDLETVIEGNAELRRGPTALRADRIEYSQPDDTVKSTGNVRISRSGNQYQGQTLQLKLDSYEGFFTEPSYQFLANGGNGHASRIDFIDDKHLVARDATFTTCKRDDERTWKPAWELSGSSFSFDMEREVGVARGAVLRFKDVPILAFPVVSFPLSDKRKSGLLPPTVNVDSVSGIGVSQPYYLNLAPNRDATLIPTVRSKRGIELAGEYRYLEPTYSGRARASLLPDDKLRQHKRWSYSLLHAGTLDTGLAAVGTVGLNLDLNRVSDNNYWRDFQNSGLAGPQVQRLLKSDAAVNWGSGNFRASARALKWQTLQDPDSPIVPPYDRLPQLAASYARPDVTIGKLAGFDWLLDADFSRFQADRRLTGQPNAERTVARAQLGWAYRAPGWYVAPRFQLHTTSYRFDAPLANGVTSASRVVPTVSVDAGLQFERSTRLLGRDFRQTLEPRAFYVRTPYRDQRLLPNYDTAATDFNFATVFTENAFVGNDRISDANLLTLGATSRLIDPMTGAEALRVALAQRLRFDDQQVTLPGIAPVPDRISDLLLGASLNWAPQWGADATVQYNPKTRRSERSSFSARYRPGNYRVVTASLRHQRDVSRLIDVGWQWPLNDFWGDKGHDLGPGRGEGGGRYYTVGRLNYSIPDRKLVDSVLGLEYDGCCWIGRVVLQRSQRGSVASNTRIMFQLELVGFSRLGVNPLDTLKSNIPQYQYLREPGAPPSRFTNYD